MKNGRISPCYNRRRPLPHFLVQLSDRMIQVLYAEEFKRPDYNEILHTVFELIRKYHIEKIYIDGANPSFIRSLKVQLDEDPEYEKAIARYKSQGWDWENSSCMQVVPINFHSRHNEMLAHSKLFLERGHIAINPKFDKLITALRTAVDIEGTLDNLLQ
jgi:hypothetical protein